MKVSRETKRRAEYALGYIGLGMFPAAAAELDGIAAEEQLRPLVRSVRLDWHIAQKQWKRAVAVGGERARAHPGMENAWIGWAYALRELDRVDEARAVLVDREFSEVIRRALQRIDRAVLVIDCDDPAYDGPGVRVGAGRHRRARRHGLGERGERHRRATGHVRRVGQ